MSLTPVITSSVETSSGAHEHELENNQEQEHSSSDSEVDSDIILTAVHYTSL